MTTPRAQARSEEPALDVVIPTGKAEQWERRHAEGAVPGRWPYGLHHLGDSSSLGRVSVRLRPIAERGRLRRVAALLPRPVSSRSERTPTALAWDENVAARMVASRDYDEMHCGVIWATDRWREDPSSVTATTRRTLAAMASVWTLSRPQLDSLQGLLPSSVGRHFVKFGIDEEFYAYAEFPDAPMVFSVGGDRDRDSDTLLAAFDLVAAARPDVRLVLQTPRHVAAPRGVEIVPYLTPAQLREMYAASSVVAVATRPNLHVSGMTVSLEAQSVGRPVVLTRTPGTEDYVQDSVTGYLTPPRDPGHLADRVLELLADPQAAEQMGRRGREAVESEHTDAHLAHRLREAMSL